MIATSGFLLFPPVCDSSYSIELLNGVRFITYHYWEIDGQIKFHYAGGIVGFDKGSVREIQVTDVPYREVIIEQKPPSPQKTEKKEPAPKSAPKDERKDRNFYRDKKNELMEKSDMAKRKLNLAIVSKDKSAYEEAQKEIQQLRDKLYKLSEETKAKNKGTLPQWWEEGPQP